MLEWRWRRAKQEIRPDHDVKYMGCVAVASSVQLSQETTTNKGSDKVFIFDSAIFFPGINVKTGLTRLEKNEYIFFKKEERMLKTLLLSFYSLARRHF